MTREEAINHIKYGLIENNYPLPKELGIEAFNMAIKALEQEPCEDAVSRQSMLDAITEIDDNINMDIYTNEVREIIGALPSVTPTRKRGKWIVVDNIHSQCMECGAIFCISSNDEWEINYCPNCGADMREVEEWS